MKNEKLFKAIVVILSAIPSLTGIFLLIEFARPSLFHYSSGEFTALFIVNAIDIFVLISLFFVSIFITKK